MSLPATAALLTYLLLGLGFLGCNRRPGGLPRQLLGLEPLPVGRKCPLCNLVLSHCRFGINTAKCLTRIALRFGDRLGWFKLARWSFLRLQPELDRRRCLGVAFGGKQPVGATIKTLLRALRAAQMSDQFAGRAIDIDSFQGVEFFCP
jgi:hypothetical protein